MTVATASRSSMADKVVQWLLRVAFACAVAYGLAWIVGKGKLAEGWLVKRFIWFGFVFVVLDMLKLFPFREQDESKARPWFSLAWAMLSITFIVIIGHWTAVGMKILLNGLVGPDFTTSVQGVVSPWALFICYVLIHEFIGYWHHRIMHTGFMWHIHAAHHSPEHLDWSSGYRSSAPSMVWIVATYIIGDLFIPGRPGSYDLVPVRT